MPTRVQEPRKQKKSHSSRRRLDGKSGTQQPVRAMNYEPEPFMSWLVCVTAFWASVLPSVPGFSASIEAPRLIPLAPVALPVGQVEVVTGLRVIAHAMAALLTACLHL